MLLMATCRELKMAASQERILYLREERIAKETLHQRMHQKALWLQILWGGAIQARLGKVRILSCILMLTAYIHHKQKRDFLGDGALWDGMPGLILVPTCPKHA
jgi:hypothetical protein